MKRYYIEFNNEYHIFKVVVPAKNIGQAIIAAWKFIKKFADNLITYEVKWKLVEESEEIGWKCEVHEKKED